MVETKEQEKEQISGIPETTQDTDSVNSQSTSVAEETVQSESGEAETTASEASIEPEKVDVENASHVESPEEVVEKEGDPNEIQLDLSKIEMDKDGLPVLTRLDIDRIKKSGLAVSDFEAEIGLARDAYFAAKIEFDSQDEQDAKFTAKIEETKKLLETAPEERKASIQKELDELYNLRNSLPKYNPEIKAELEKQMLNSVKAIAVYQNVSRNTLQKLINDGTVPALISSTATSVFASAYTDAILKSKGESGLYESKTIKDWKEKQLKTEDEYTRLGYMFDSLKIAEDKEIQERITKYIESAKDNKTKTKFISKILGLLNQINRPDLYNEAVITKANQEYGEIKISTVKLDEEEKVDELDEVKEEEEKRSQFIDDVENYTTAMCAIGFSYQMLNIRTAKNGDPRNIKVPTPMQFSITSFKFGEVWDKDLKFYHERYESRFNELKAIDEECENKIEEEIIERSSKHREVIRKEGLVNALYEYAFHTDKTHNYYASSKSALRFQNAIVSAEAFAKLVRILGATDDASYEQFNTVKMNVNVASMIGNNYLRYMEMLLYPDTFDADWAAKFDPNSELKRWFSENKNFVEDLMKEYFAIKDNLSHYLFFSSIVSENYAKFVEDVVNYLEANKAKAEKFNTGKKIKNKYEFVIKASYLQNFATGFSAFLGEIDKYSPIIEEKRKEFEGKSDEFNKWYEAEMHKKEIEATRPVIESILHASLGMTLIKAFLDYKEHFLTRNNNELLSRDITSYLFHEFTFSALAARSAKDPQTLAEFIKEKSASTTFKSISYEFEKDVTPDEARRALALNIINSATNILKGVLEDNADEAKANAERMQKDIERKAKAEEKSKKPTAEDLRKINIQRRKDAKKKKREVESRLWNLEKQYSSFIKDTPVVSNTITLTKSEGKYFVEVLPNKDTRVVIKVLFCRNDFSRDNTTDIKNFFGTDGLVINKNNPTSVEKAFNTAYKIEEDKLMNLGEKWYYNQYLDRQFAVVDGKSLLASDLNSMNRSQINRFVVNTVLDSEYKNIVEKIKAHAIAAGVVFDEKDIAMKKNCKFDIKYFNGSKMSDYIQNLNDNGNLNFFVNDKWVLLSFELNYDLVNVVPENKESPKPVEEKKEVKKEEKKPTFGAHTHKMHDTNPNPNAGKYRR